MEGCTEGIKRQGDSDRNLGGDTLQNNADTSDATSGHTTDRATTNKKISVLSNDIEGKRKREITNKQSRWSEPSFRVSMLSPGLKRKCARLCQDDTSV